MRTAYKAAASQATAKLVNVEEREQSDKTEKQTSARDRRQAALFGRDRVVTSLVRAHTRALARPAATLPIAQRNHIRAFSATAAFLWWS